MTETFIAEYVIAIMLLLLLLLFIIILFYNIASMNGSFWCLHFITVLHATKPHAK